MTLLALLVRLLVPIAQPILVQGARAKQGIRWVGSSRPTGRVVAMAKTLNSSAGTQKGLQPLKLERTRSDDNISVMEEHHKGVYQHGANLTAAPPPAPLEAPRAGIATMFKKTPNPL